jgi:hypothetical protein
MNKLPLLFLALVAFLVFSGCNNTASNNVTAKATTTETKAGLTKRNARVVSASTGG